MKRDNVSLRPLHTTLGDISDEVVDKRGPRHGEWFTYVDISSIDRHNKRIVDPKLLRVAEAPSRAKQFIKEGDVLISMTRPNLNAVAKVPRELDGAVCSTGFHVLRSKSAHPGYLYYLVQTPQFINAMETVVQGALYPAVRPKDISSFPILLPSSFDDQQLLLAHLDLQLSRLDAAVAALKRAQANLKRYRASVLQAAVTGRLVPTEHDLAQAEGRDYETGEQLLERILTERRRTSSGKGKAAEPMPPAGDQISERPVGWSVASIDQLSQVVRGASPRPAGDPKYFGGTVPWITVGPITADASPYLTHVPSYLTDEGRRHSRFIEQQTLLLSNSGATLGVPKITLIGGCINDGVAALLGVEYPLKLYLYYFLTSQTEKLRRVNQGAAQPNLNTTIIRAIVVPLPPLAEQARIVEEVERRLSVADRLEATLEANLRRATRLRQAILKKAFTFEDGNEEAGAQKEEG